MLLAFVAAARLVFIAIEETGSERRLLLAVKNNLGALAPGLGYRLAQTIVGGGIVASHLVYDNQPVSTTANEAVRAQPNDQSARKDANDFLQEELADGPRSAVEIKRAAAEAGFSWATIRRAQGELRIKPRKMGLAGEWQWDLPAEDAHGAHYRCS
jgi:putative DNA primase/helicase